MWDTWAGLLQSLGRVQTSFISIAFKWTTINLNVIWQSAVDFFRYISHKILLAEKWQHKAPARWCKILFHIIAAEILAGYWASACQWPGTQGWTHAPLLLVTRRQWSILIGRCVVWSGALSVRSWHRKTNNFNWCCVFQVGVSSWVRPGQAGLGNRKE